MQTLNFKASNAVAKNNNLWTAEARDDMFQRREKGETWETICKVRRPVLFAFDLFFYRRHGLYYLADESLARPPALLYQTPRLSQPGARIPAQTSRMKENLK